MTKFDRITCIFIFKIDEQFIAVGIVVGNYKFLADYITESCPRVISLDCKIIRVLLYSTRIPSVPKKAFTIL